MLAVVLSAGASDGGLAQNRGAERTLPPRVKFGAFVDGMQADPSRLARFESMIGERTALASYYWGFGDIFPGPVERTLSDDGKRDVLVSWDMGPTRFTDWSGGALDPYLDQIVAAARSYPYRLYVRPWPEMNGDWQTFQPTPQGERPNGGTYAEFVAAWRHVVSYTRAAGATNLKWVFNPTADTYAETTPVAKIWPGRQYVDVLGLDGFNWGRDSGWGRWRTFDEIFAAQYRRLVALHPTAPVWICEFGSKEPKAEDGAPRDPTHTKAAWMRQALTSRAFPRVRMLVYFQADKERDWRINSSRGSLKAVKAILRRS